MVTPSCNFGPFGPIFGQARIHPQQIASSISKEDCGTLLSTINEVGISCSTNVFFHLNINVKFVESILLGYSVCC